jgi:ADP-heptose:LPS heptosyltransferase
MAAVVRECDMAIGNDTGPLHMASLSGIPTLGIFDYIQPAEVGYAMPWFACVVSRNEPLQTFYAKKRCQSVLAEISSDKVRRAFDFLAEKFLY